MRIHVSIEWFNPAEDGINILQVIYFLEVIFFLVSRGYFMKGFHDLDILPLALLAFDPMFPWLEVRVFYHLVTVGTPAGEGTDSYLSSFRHDTITQKLFSFNARVPQVWGPTEGQWRIRTPDILKFI
ncbi:MAG: hypothetical protein JXA50_05300 [Deltaproteobacteria bacterium]|nr:hypothetical protein [Deltaproteobacteria bacterium]